MSFSSEMVNFAGDEEYVKERHSDSDNKNKQSNAMRVIGSNLCLSTIYCTLYYSPQSIMCVLFIIVVFCEKIKN
jgi:hypothetical protein